MNTTESNTTRYMLDTGMSRAVARLVDIFDISFADAGTIIDSYKTRGALAIDVAHRNVRDGDGVTVKEHIRLEVYY